MIAPVLDPWLGGFLADARALGIPAIVSDLPLLRELLATDAAFATVPGWLTPCSRRIPTAEEVEPWFKAVVRLWDDPGRKTNRAHFPTERVKDIESSIAAVRRSPAGSRPEAPVVRNDWAVLVPFMDTIEPECENALRALERAGVHVVRCRGCSAIDHARSLLASEAVRRGSSSLLFIDSDIAFEPNDALRLFARAEPVVAGVYLKKNAPALSSMFPPEISSVVFGAASPGLYPLKYAAGGFLRIQSSVLQKMTRELPLPLCNTHIEAGFWPFFQPLVYRQDDGTHHYLAEDWAFSHRLRQVGITPLADTTIRLFHLGRRGYTWEDATRGPDCHDSFTFNFSG